MHLGSLEWASLLWFLTCWVGYGRYSGLKSTHGQRLQDALQLHIRQWIVQIEKRDNRMVDTAIIANIERNATFMASSSLLIIAGLVTAIGSTDKALALFTQLPFVRFDPQTWEIGLIMMTVVFAYAFFTFTWCIRQWGFASILIGSVTHHSQPPNARLAESLERLISLAVYHFNVGLRAYYYSLALLTWFIHPLLFMLATTWVIAVLYRREYHSRTLKALASGL
ncbi:DUF599 domain-containing protein [Thiofilum flexile]|uniref:DUF599 domain-containing protein n=1 Tax=Thiofilum flexile TaxID=125627 RepID=UPI000377CE2D|nr:DUF599 domain-containing protein [Thiofilum flexile]